MGKYFTLMAIATLRCIVQMNYTEVFPQLKLSQQIKNHAQHQSQSHRAERQRKIETVVNIFNGNEIVHIGFSGSNTVVYVHVCSTARQWHQICCDRDKYFMLITRNQNTFYVYIQYVRAVRAYFIAVTNRFKPKQLSNPALPNCFLVVVCFFPVVFPLPSIISIRSKMSTQIPFL